MFGAEFITRTKFLVPRPKRTYLGRDRLHRLLDGALDVPVTEIVAGTGYGKSSLLSTYLEASGTAAMWYGLTDRDADPQVFALHLAHLAHRHFPDSAERSLALLAMPGGTSKHGEAAIEALADGLLDRLEVDTWLVLDDFHLLHASAETLALVNHLALTMPPRLHLVLASRHRPQLPDLARWRLQGDVLTLDQGMLAFKPDEVSVLFKEGFGLALDAATVNALMAETEGWAMALPLLAGRMRAGEDGTHLRDSAHSLRDLFDYLAREVMGTLEPEERDFLLDTAVLQRLEPVVCDPLAGTDHAATLLQQFNERGLFLIPLEPGVYRHHHLFREFLMERLQETGRLHDRHRAAARVLLPLGEEEEAIAHLLQADEWVLAASCMARVAPELVNQGRYERLAQWIARLPEVEVDRQPALAICQGDVCRLTSRYDEAIAWYDRAALGYGENPDGKSRALASKALVYLDTVQPALAEEWLEQALKEATDPRRRAELRMLLAENKLNMGDLTAAQAIFAEARQELPEAAEHEARLHLRTGRLAEGRALLQTELDREDDGSTRSHREAALVQAFLMVLMGEPEPALALSSRGRERARAQGATWTEAVSWIREGHAHLVMGQPAKAEGAYREAIALAGAVGVARLKAEPLMGLALHAGRAGDLASAASFAKEGLEIAQAAGDAWLGALLSLTLGCLYAGAGDARAERWLLQAQTAFERTGDTHGLALAALGFARLAIALNEGKSLHTRLRALTQLVRRQGYGFLLTKGTLLGFRDASEARAFVELAVERGVPRSTFQPWLVELGLAETAVAPASDALRVRTLGAFRVWRGGTELGDRAWGREKARQLFHLLLVYRGQSLPKSRLIDLLWPDLDAQSGDQTFRVALNALNKALDPDRPSGQASRFISRQGLNYGLMLGPDLWIDAMEFERLMDAAQALDEAGDDATEAYRQALELNEGEFLRDYPQYEQWCEQERERLAARFSEGALKLARMLLKRGDDAGAAVWAQRLIERDRTSEEAYRCLMIAQYRQGDRPAALRTYDRCVEALAAELDVDPMPETEEVFERITALEPIEP